MRDIKRSKLDEQFEKQMEEIVKGAWKNRKQLFATLIIIIPSIFIYLWGWQRPLLTKYLPNNKIHIIENTASYYFSKIELLLLCTLLVIVIRGVFIYLWNMKNYRYILALPHSKDGVSPQTLGEAIRIIHNSKRSPLLRLALGKERYTYLIHHAEDEKVYFYLGAPKDRIRFLKDHWSRLYSRVEYFSPDKLRFPEPWKKKKFKHIPFEVKVRNKKSVGGRLKFTRKKQDKTLSLSRYKVDKLPIILNDVRPNTWLQIAFSPNDGRKLQREIEKAQKESKMNKKSIERSFVDKEELQSWDHRFSGNEVAFDVTVSLATEDYPGVPMLKSMAMAIHGIMEDVNGLKYRKWRDSVKRFPSLYPYQMVWTGSELANLVHFPHLSGEGLAVKQKEMIPHNAEGRELLPKKVLSNKDGVLFGYQYHPFVKDREVRVLRRYVGEHWVLTGENGSGKSTLLNQILKSMHDDFISKPRSAGYSFVDPARDTALLMLNNLMTREIWEQQAAKREGREPRFKINWNKVKWISFRNTDYPPALNLLYKMPGESDDLAADQIFRVIQDYFTAAPQTERLLKMSIRTLMSDPGERHTILGIRPLIYNEQFRKRILARLTKPEHREIRFFWSNEAEGMLDTSTVSLLNRLDIFYSNPFLKRVFGQKAFNFNIRQWMDEGCVILYDFSGMSEQEIGLVGSYLTYLYYRIADTRDAESTPLLHLFCIDEAHKVKASILPYIVREQRKKGLSLGAVTQSIIDLPDELFDALTEVTGNIFVCKQGSKNAKLAASAFTVEDSNGKQKTVYSETFLRNLPKRTAAIKITDNVDDVEKAYQTVVEIPPLDRYLPNGEVATFGDKAKIAEANRWTLEKAKQLQGDDGLHYTKIDKEINNYLYGDDVENEEEETAEQKVESMLVFLEKKDKDGEGNDLSRVQKVEDDFPLEVKEKQVEITPLEEEELQQALQDELEKVRKEQEEQEQEPESMLDLL